MNAANARIALHAIVAGVFFFALQRFALHESIENSLLWSLFFALAAAGLAWSQTRR